MAPPRKTIQQYEREAKREGQCLVHPSAGAARRVYQLRHGRLLSRVCVCHRCDNPSCIEDRHHFPGSKRDNTQDAVQKGRHSGFRKGGVRFKGPHTAEARRKIAEASAKRWTDPKHRRKVILALLRRKVSK